MSEMKKSKSEVEKKRAEEENGKVILRKRKGITRYGKIWDVMNKKERGL